MQLGGDSCPLLGVYRTTSSTRNGELMHTILYTFVLTAGAILSGFFGWTDDAPIIRNIALMVSGYCMGGIALLIFENWEYK